MKNKVMSLVGMAVITATMGTAHAAEFTKAGTATGHVGIYALSSWTITEKTSGVWTTDGAVSTNLVIEVKNDSALAAKYALQSPPKFSRTDGKWNIVGDSVAGSKTIAVKPAEADVLTFSPVHKDYASTEELAAGASQNITIIPDETGNGQFTAGNYTIDLDLLVRTP